jgi:hypothetical protein
MDADEALAEAVDKDELLKLAPQRPRVAQVRHLAAPLVPMFGVLLMCWTVSWLLLGRHGQVNALVPLTCACAAIAGAAGAGLSLAREWRLPVRATDVTLPVEAAALNVIGRYFAPMAVVVFGAVPLFDLNRAGSGDGTSRIIGLTVLSLLVSGATFAWLGSGDALRRVGWAVVGRFPSSRQASR